MAEEVSVGENPDPEIAATSHISGGHTNPAVTFATWLAGRMDTAKGVM